MVVYSLGPEKWRNHGKGTPPTIAPASTPPSGKASGAARRRRVEFGETRDDSVSSTDSPRNQCITG